MRTRRQQYLVAAVAAFLVAATSFVAVAFRQDALLRIVTGALWTVVGVGWLNRFSRLDAGRRDHSHRKDDASGPRAGAHTEGAPP